MEFLQNLSSLKQPKNQITLQFTSTPLNRDVYFRLKQKEIINQYENARMFMEEIDKDDWDHWFEKQDDENAQKYVELIHKATFFEVALFYYNIVVDLSWVMCYVSIEYALELKGSRVDFGEIQPIDEAYTLMRKAENLVTNPSAEGNPLKYFKLMEPKFSAIIDTVINFWAKFKESNIRHYYNFCKHKGKPLYTEIEDLSNEQFFKYSFQNNNIPIRTDDVRLKIGLMQAIDELLEFDNEKLFSYISNLFEKLEQTLEPSSLVID